MQLDATHCIKGKVIKMATQVPAMGVVVLKRPTSPATLPVASGLPAGLKRCSSPKGFGYWTKTWLRRIVDLVIIPGACWFLALYGPAMLHCPYGLFIGKYILAPITIFAFFKWLAPTMLVKHDLYQAGVYGSPFGAEHGAPRDTYSGHARAAWAIERHGPGFSLIFPGEELIKMVDLTRHIMVKGDLSKPVTLSDGTPIYFDYIALPVALPGSLARFITYTDDD